MPERYWKNALFVVLYTTLFTFPFYAFKLLGWNLAMSPAGNDELRETADLFLFLLCPLAFLLALGSGMVCLVKSTRDKKPRFAFLLCLACLTILADSLFCSSLAERLQRAALRKFMERSKPLIGAIRTYQEKYGTAPERLEKLVPEFLAEIPGTGIGVSPKYIYWRAGDDRGLAYEGNPWALSIPLPGGVLDMLATDVLVYLPSQHYPERGPGGIPVYKPFGEWAFAHWYIP